LKKPIPPFVAPASPVWRPIPPSGPQWRHEVKFDGWRVQARKNHTDVVVLSRLGNDISHRAPDVVRALARLPSKNFVLDGELIAVAKDGRPWFEGTGLARQRHCLCAFDLLWLVGEDLRPLPLGERRRRLAVLLHGAPPCLHVVEAFEDPIHLLAAVEKHGLEGIVSKRIDGAVSVGLTIGLDQGEDGRLARSQPGPAGGDPEQLTSLITC
jgi:bifunctional non-homologous end joining protein LigD